MSVRRVEKEMFKLRFAACLLAVSPVAWVPVAAQEITQMDRAALEARIAAFDSVVNGGRIGETVDFLPPRLISMIAEKVGMPEPAFRAMMVTQMAELLKVATFVSFGMNIDAATTATTPGGRRTYMLIPTESVFDIADAGRMRAKSSTVALKDDGQWYLVRIDNAQQIVMLRNAYPEFAGVDFP